MKTMNVKEYLPTAIDAARDAGIEILDVYNTDDFKIEQKRDKSPSTLADKNANIATEKKLKPIGFPILSEDGDEIAYETRKNWETFWMVDPLDGTKEFIDKNGEFAVNIALIRNNEPIFGVVYAPVTDKLYFGGKEIGAFTNETMAPEHQLELIKNETGTIRLVTSRSHTSKETENFIAQYKNADAIPMGSSLKFMAIADSEADIYPRFTDTMEWDTAAAHAILKGMDIEILNMEDEQPLTYNKKELLNPNFIVNVAKPSLSIK